MYVVGAVGLGLSVYQMSQAKSAANDAQNAANVNAKLAREAAQEKSVIDGMQIQATMNANIAQVQSQDAQVQQLQRTSDIMGMQGKADNVFRKEEYNKLASSQMVMGAAQGRSMDGYGSFGAIVNKSEEDFRWDLMWNENTTAINQAALYEDMINVRQAQSTSLMMGAEQARIGQESIMLDLRNADRGLNIQGSQAEQIWRTSNRQATNSFINNLGSSGTVKLGTSLLDSAKGIK